MLLVKVRLSAINNNYAIFVELLRYLHPYANYFLSQAHKSANAFEQDILITVPTTCSIEL